MDARDKLLQAAIEVYGTTGTRGATTRRIARQAGVNEVTLFRIFGSKEALLRDAIQIIYDRNVAVPLPEDPRDPEAELTQWCRLHHEFLIRIRSILRISMAEFAEHPEHVRRACRLPIRVSNELHDYLLRLRAKRLARGAWSPRAATAFLMGAVFQDAMQRDIMPERFPYSERAAVRHYIGLFLSAIGATRRRTPARRTVKHAKKDHND